MQQSPQANLIAHILRKVIFSFILLLFFNKGFSQGLILNPLSDCGLTYGYDASGNRIFRVLIECGHSSHKTDETNANESPASESPKNSIVDTLISQIQVALFPNPTAGPFTLSFSQPLDYLEVVIINSNGQVVRSEKTSGQQIPVDISGLSAGVYYVKLYTTKEEFSKIVVKK